MQEFILILVVFFIFFRLFRNNVFIHVQRPQNNNREPEAPREKEGTIKIQKIDTQNQNKKDDGDYIDYEEVN